MGGSWKTMNEPCQHSHAWLATCLSRGAGGRAARRGKVQRTFCRQSMHAHKCTCTRTRARTCRMNAHARPHITCSRYVCLCVFACTDTHAPIWHPPTSLNVGLRRLSPCQHFSARALYAGGVLTGKSGRIPSFDTCGPRVAEIRVQPGQREGEEPWTSDQGCYLNEAG